LVDKRLRPQGLATLVQAGSKQALRTPWRQSSGDVPEVSSEGISEGIRDCART
jgi:hypothetical protein